MMKAYLSRLMAGPLCAAAVVTAAGSFAVGDAQAGTAAGWTRSSLVGDAVTDLGGGKWIYEYTVKNTSTSDTGEGSDQLVPIIVDWELPWFGDAGIDPATILSPSNWAWAIETIGPANPATGWGGIAEWQTPGDFWYSGPDSPFTTGTQILHWYNTCWTQPPNDVAAVFSIASCAEGQFDNAIFPDGELAGFSFVAEYDKTAAPYQASWAFLPVQTGDPAFPLAGGIPNSPTLNPPTGVPEPGTLALIALAALALAVRRPRTVRRD